MSVLSRLYDFVSNTTIRSSEVDSEFNQIINLINGSDLIGSLRIRRSTDYSSLDDSNNPAVVIGGQIEQGLLSGHGAVHRIFRLGEMSSVLELHDSGQIVSRVGNQGTSVSSQRMVVSGATYVVGTRATNLGASITDVHQFTIGAALFGTSGPTGGIRVFSAGNMAANGNNKQLKFTAILGGGNVDLFDTGLVAFNNKPYTCEIIFVLSGDGVAELKVVALFKCDTVEIRSVTSLTGVDFVSGFDCKWQAKGNGDGDVSQELFIVEKFAGIN